MRPKRPVERGSWRIEARRGGQPKHAGRFQRMKTAKKRRPKDAVSRQRASSNWPRDQKKRELVLELTGARAARNGWQNQAKKSSKKERPSCHDGAILDEHRRQKRKRHSKSLASFSSYVPNQTIFRQILIQDSIPSKALERESLVVNAVPTHFRQSGKFPYRSFPALFTTCSHRTL